MKTLGYFLCCLLWVAQSFASDGGVTSNGGDSVAAEFTKVGRHIVEILRTQVNAAVSSEQFAQAVSTTLVASKDRTILRGNEVDAINYPSERRIEVSRIRWLENKDLVRRRYVLVMHEYLGILGIDDSRYQISENLFEVPGVAKNSIRCAAFNDNVFGKSSDGPFVLELTNYGSLTITSIKDQKGRSLPFKNLGIGDVVVTGVIDPEAEGPTAMVAISLGFSVRMVQIPIGRLQPGRLTALKWDVASRGRTTEVTEIECTQINW